MLRRRRESMQSTAKLTPPKMCKERTEKTDQEIRRAFYDEQRHHSAYYQQPGIMVSGLVIL